MKIKELIKQLEDMRLLYGDKVILTVTDGELDYRVKNITGISCAKQIGEIREEDIPRLVEWAEYTNRFGHQISILNEIRTIDGCLNPIREFLRIMSRYTAESEDAE